VPRSCSRCDAQGPAPLACMSTDVDLSDGSAGRSIAMDAHLPPPGRRIKLSRASGSFGSRLGGNPSLSLSLAWSRATLSTSAATLVAAAVSERWLCWTIHSDGRPLTTTRPPNKTIEGQRIVRIAARRESVSVSLSRVVASYPVDVCSNAGGGGGIKTTHPPRPLF